MSQNVYYLTAAFLVGGILSLFYFFGLWWTVRRLPQVSRPGLWMVVSFVLRTTVLLTSFYLVMAGDWVNLAVCFAGFFLVRIVTVRWLGLAPSKGVRSWS